MDVGLFGQYVMNGLMLGVMYALVAVGFTLFFGVMNIINFSHGHVLMVGAFVGLATYLGLSSIGVENPWGQLAAAMLVAVSTMALMGAAVARYLVLPLKNAPPLNTLLITLMLGTALHEAVRLFYPRGANPQRFPSLLPTDAYSFGNFTLRIDSVILLGTGLLAIVGIHLLINRTKLGLAIRAVAQDEDTAKTMGINFNLIVLITFAIGSALAAITGILHGLYYGEVNFAMGLLLGVIGFSSAIVGGLGNIYGAIIGGFLFAALQTLGVVAMPFASAYKDVFAFGVIILIMAWRPTGLISEKISERV